MTVSKIKICPLLSVGRSGDPAPCVEDRCAWFHVEVDPADGAAEGACVLASIASALDRWTTPGNDVWEEEFSNG